MKKGVILYVTQGKDEVPLQGRTELNAISRSLGVADVCVAVSEEDIDYGWWKLIAKGVNQVLLMTVAYNNALESFQSHRPPLRLWG